MDHTEKYHLPQWVKTDRIMMDDFNQMCADIEEGLRENAQAAETAHQEAELARQEAAEKPYVIGTYSGSSLPQKITLGFRPSMVIVGRRVYGDKAEDGMGECAIFTNGGVSSVLEIENDGFKACGQFWQYPLVNKSGATHPYIAFR